MARRRCSFVSKASLKPLPPDNVCAVVVTYHPQSLLRSNLEQLSLQVAEVVVVDNGSGTATAELLRIIEAEFGIRVVRNGCNLGIAAALNIGIKHAIAGGYQWIATFDQDSEVTPGFIDGLLAAYQNCPDREHVALIAPNLFYPESNESELKQTGPLPEFTHIRSAITSGSLIRADVFAKAGYYDEPMFIDYVDYDFNLRLQTKGFKLIRANRVLLHHRLGTAEKHSLLGRDISIKSHSAWRRYYITRNRVIVYRRFGLRFPGWCLHDFGWFFLELGKVLVLESSKLAKVQNILKGLWHGLIGKTGHMLPPP